MKSLNEHINESLDVNESFLSFGLTVIVALKLAGLALGGIAGLGSIWYAVKIAIKNSKEYQDTIIELDKLLAPYKNDLLNTEFASKLFGENGSITEQSLKNKGFGIVYFKLEEDIKSVLSADDFKRYKKITDRIFQEEYENLKRLSR